MPNPFEALIEMQRQTFASMQSMSRMWLTGWMRVFEQQSQMLDQAARRTEDKGPRPSITSPRAPIFRTITAIAPAT